MACFECVGFSTDCTGEQISIIHRWDMEIKLALVLITLRHVVKLSSAT